MSVHDEMYAFSLNYDAFFASFLHVMRFFHKLLIFLTKNAIFYSFNNSFNNTVEIFIQRIYSFKQNANNSFKEFIHSTKYENYSFKENIHSS